MNFRSFFLIFITFVILNPFAHASKRKCEELATQTSIETDPMVAISLQAHELPPGEFNILFQKLWNKRYTIIAEEMGPGKRLQFLPLSEETRGELQQLYNHFLPMILARIGNFHRFRGGIEDADYLSEAHDSMLRTLRRYNPTHESKASFKTYFSNSLINELKRFAKRRSAVLGLANASATYNGVKAKTPEIQQAVDRASVSNFLSRSLDSPVYRGGGNRNLTYSEVLGSDEPSPLDLLISKEDQLNFDIAFNLAQLNPRERQAIELRFFGREDREMNLAEVGAQMGLSRERVRQIARDGLLKLKTVLSELNTSREEE